MLGARAARAEVRILASPGGQVGPFLDLFERVRESGERVVIDGPCLSACTLVLSMVPNERICVTRRAVLGFHAARSMDGRGRMYAEPEASQAVLEAYPAPVRDWISRRGGLTSRLLLLRGRELAAIYPSVPVARSLTSDRAVDHPGNAELVDAHAETLGEEGLAERHVDGAAFGQRLELALGVGGILDRSETEKPCGLWKWPGGASDAISTSPSIVILACMIFFFQSGGVGISAGPSS